MNKFSTLVIALLMLLFGQQSYAQVTATVTLTDNTSSDVSMDNSGEIYFNGDRLIIMESALTGNTSSWEIDQVRKVTFDGDFTSILTPTESEQISLYPNPAADQFYLSGLSDKATPVIIYSIAGSIMKQQYCAQGEAINVSDLPTGLYFVRVGNQTLKLSKQ